MHRAEEARQLRSLAAMARVLAGSSDLSRMLEAAAEETCRAIDAATVSVSRLESGTSAIRTLVNVGDLAPWEERLPTDEVYVVEDFANLGPVLGEQQVVTDDVLDPDCDPAERELLTALQKGCSVNAPIVVDGRLWGVFFGTRHVGAPVFRDSDADYLEALLAILAGAISRCLREESLEQLAYEDPLTGLANRRKLDERIARAFDVGPGVQRDVTVVTADINRLKEVNDTLGHVAGDQLIQSVAKALLKAFSRLPGSLVARVGGDEFTVLVSGQDPVEVVKVADELCRRTWQFGTGAGISCGAATAVLHADAPWTPHDMLAAADRAQYVAKHGRLSSTVTTVLDDVLAER